MFASQGKAQFLPRQQPTDRQMYSVPTLEGRFAYYRSNKPTPPRNDDFPLPMAAHPNKIGIASTAIGREMPRDATYVGTGEQAIGCVTAMPGQSPPLGGRLSRGSGGGADGLGSFSETVSAYPNAVVAVVAAVIGFVATKGRRL